LRGPADLQEVDIVLHEDRDAVACLQAKLAEQLRALVRALLQFAITHARARLGDDDRGLVGRLFGDDGRMQSRFLE